MLVLLRMKMNKAHISFGYLVIFKTYTIKACALKHGIYLSSCIYIFTIIMILNTVWDCVCQCLYACALQAWQLIRGVPSVVP